MIMNIEMTIKIFLYAFYLFLALICFFTFANLYHIFKFGVKNKTTFMLTFIFLSGLVLLIAISFNALAHINWETPIEFASSASFKTLSY